MSDNILIAIIVGQVVFLICVMLSNCFGDRIIGSFVWFLTGILVEKLTNR